MSSSSTLISRNNTTVKSDTAHHSAVKQTPFFNSKHNFFQASVQVQPRLTVNASNDIYEKEADVMADRVMRMPDPQIYRQEKEEEMLQMKEQVLAIQRKCKACEAEESLQMQSIIKQKNESPEIQRKCAECEKEERERLQRTSLAGNTTPFFQRKEVNGSEVTEGVASSLQSGKSGGQSLPDKTRSWMENRFGTDFSRVKIHTDTNAVQLSRNLNAKAFTHSSDIYFNWGEFAPGTNAGKRLLAHELTHVLQQGNSKRTVQRKPDEDDIQNLSRSDEIALSRSSPGKFKIESGFPPVMSIYNFGINDHRIKKEHKENLNILGELFSLMHDSNWQASAIGHADSTGEPTVNDPLSAKRADEVRKYLKTINKGKVFIQGQGENRPVTTNESISGRTRNRRVDIVFTNPNIDIEVPDPIPDPKTVCQLYPSLCDEDDFCDRHPSLCGKGFCAKHPDWCALPVLCLLFPPACICLAKPIVCACGRFPALCACIANPEACIPDKPDKPDPDEKKPKPEKACPIKVDLPSGVIEANKLEGVGYAFLSYPFDMNIVFSDDSQECECWCGEYAQLVRGSFEEFEAGGKDWKLIKHKLPNGKILDKNNYHEDGPLEWGAYGHRYWDDKSKQKPKNNIREDKFTKTRETGCHYHGKDEPQIRADQGVQKIRMFLEFKGGPVDICKSPGKRVALDAYWSSWIIHGEAQVKSSPPGPSKRPSKGPSDTEPDITTPEETDIAFGKPVPSWYAGGIPSDATSGEYQMKVGFKVDGITKLSSIKVKIVVSQTDFIQIVTMNKKNLNLNPGKKNGEQNTPVIVKVNSREKIKRNTLLRFEKVSKIKGD